MSPRTMLSIYATQRFVTPNMRKLRVAGAKISVRTRDFSSGDFTKAIRRESHIHTVKFINGRHDDKRDPGCFALAKHDKKKIMALSPIFNPGNAKKLRFIFVYGIA